MLKSNGTGRASETTPFHVQSRGVRLQAKKASLLSKRLSAPVVIRESKEGYVGREVAITHEMVWHSLSNQNHFVFHLINSNHLEINLDKTSAKPAAMTNADVVKFKDAGFGDGLIIDRNRRGTICVQPRTGRSGYAAEGRDLRCGDPSNAAREIDDTRSELPCASRCSDHSCESARCFKLKARQGFRSHAL